MGNLFKGIAKMKLVALTAAITAFASNAIAGSVAYVAPVVPEMVVEETGSMGGSGMWLIPLLAIAVVFLLMQDDDCCDSQILE